MWVLTLWAWRAIAASRAASSTASCASRKAFSEHLASITNTAPPGRRTFTSGRRRPSSLSTLNCSSKSNFRARPAAQGRGQLARLGLGGGRGGEHLGDLGLEGAGFLSARLLRGGGLRLEL